MRKILTVVAMLLAFTSNAETLTLSDSNTVLIRGPITDASASKTIASLLEKDSKLKRSEHILLVLDTPGGSIDAGNMIIAAAKGLGRQVDTVTIFAASMGYHTAESLGTRYIIESGTLMSHRAAIGGLAGQVPGEANSRLNWITALTSRMDQVAADRIGVSLNSYKESIRDELWLTSDQAISKNHADKIVALKCDSSLLGTEEVAVNIFFGTFVVEFSKCPLISAPVSVKADNVISDKALKEKAVNYVRDLFTAKKAVRLVNETL